MLTITTGAIQKLKGILNEEGEGPFLRILVMPGGGHGLQYMLTPEKETKDDDLVEEMDGLRVVLDTDSAMLLEGAEIDYVEEFPRAGFVISNPNASAFAGGGCACGGGACACGGHGAAEASQEAGACGGGACACGGHGAEASQEACACGGNHAEHAEEHAH
jgi:iron-sulfur cluster assembly accessory protein